MGMRHAALRSLAAVAVGIALSRAVSVPWWLAAFVVAVCVALTRVSRGFSLYAGLMAAALAYAGSAASLPADPRLYQAGSFEGVVVSEPTPREPGRAVVALSAPRDGKVTLWLRDSTQKLRYGDVVRVAARIRPLDYPRNPGLTDYNVIVAARGFVGTASVPVAGLEVISRGSGPFLMTRVVVPVRRYMLEVAEGLLPGAEGGLLVGLVLGGSQGLPNEVQNAFSDAGIVHILAVSGMNVSIVVAVVWILLSVLGVRRWWRFVVGVGVVGFYVILAGSTAAPARAGLMACAVLLSVPTHRRVTPVASLSVAGLALLLIDPRLLCDVGAQLSFAATMGIVLAVGLAEPRLPAFGGVRWLRNLIVLPLVVSLAASLATAPLLLHHFHRVQPLAFLTSAAVVPLVGVAMPLGIVVLLVSIVSHSLASVFAQSLWLVLHVLLRVTTFMGSLEWAILEPGRVSWVGVGWLYGLGLLALKLNRPWARKTLAYLLLAGLSVAAWQRVLTRPRTSVTFLDPRRGDAVLLEDSLGRKVLFDAGINGTRILRDYLHCRGIHKLDAVVVTHPDIDHYGGLLDMDARCRIPRLLVATTESQDTAYQSLLCRLQATGTEVVSVGKGSSLSGTGFDIRFIWPDNATRAMYVGGMVATNDVSLVASVISGGFRMLLTGDLDDPDLIADDSLRAGLLKSPHHGSRRGNREVLYERVKPDYVIVMGRYPTPARLAARFEGKKVCYVNTRVDGAVVLRLNKGRPMLQRPFRPLGLPGENLRPTDARSEPPSRPYDR